MNPTAHTKRRCAWAVFGLSALATFGGLPFRARVLDTSVVSDGLLSLSFFAMPLSGLLIARRDPSNRIAWLLLAIGAVVGLGSVAEPYATYGVATSPDSLPAAGVVAAVNNGLWIPVIGMAGTYLILLFPDGRLPSPRWRPVAWASGLTMGLLIVAFVFRPGPLELYDSPVHNPLGVSATKPVLDALFLLLPVLPLCMLASAGALVTRFRRSRGVERLQLKWLATAAALVASTYLTSMIVSFSYNAMSGGTYPGWLDVLQSGSVLSFGLIPLSIGIAILRHGLYEIDRLISRTVSYAVLTGTLLAVYLGIVSTASRLVLEGNSLAVAAATLAVAGLFQPLRRRVQAAVDRRFNRSRYDAERTVEVFRARLREEVDLDTVRTDLLDVVQQTMQPASAMMWLRTESVERAS